MARHLCCRGMCKDLLRSDGQQWNYDNAKFPSNLNCGQKNVSETGPRSAKYDLMLLACGIKVYAISDGPQGTQRRNNNPHNATQNRNYTVRCFWLMGQPWPVCVNKNYYYYLCVGIRWICVKVASHLHGSFKRSVFFFNNNVTFEGNKCLARN